MVFCPQCKVRMRLGYAKHTSQYIVTPVHDWVPCFYRKTMYHMQQRVHLGELRSRWWLSLFMGRKLYDGLSPVNFGSPRGQAALIVLLPV